MIHGQKEGHSNENGTGTISDEEIIKKVRDNIDLRPGMLIDRFNLRRPIYLQIASYGHFGREDPDFTWEKTDKAEELKQEAGLD